MLERAIYLTTIVLAGIVFGRCWRQSSTPGKSDPPASTIPAPPLDPCADHHELIPIDAQALVGDSLAYRQTVVLKRCSRCGLHIALAYAGQWTIGDFVKKRSEVAELERMVGR